MGAFMAQQQLVLHVQEPKIFSEGEVFTKTDDMHVPAAQ